MLSIVQGWCDICLMYYVLVPGIITYGVIVTAFFRLARVTYVRRGVSCVGILVGRKTGTTFVVRTNSKREHANTRHCCLYSRGTSSTITSGTAGGELYPSLWAHARTHAEESSPGRVSETRAFAMARRLQQAINTCVIRTDREVLIEHTCREKAGCFV